MDGYLPQPVGLSPWSFSADYQQNHHQLQQSKNDIDHDQYQEFLLDSVNHLRPFYAAQAQQEAVTVATAEMHLSHPTERHYSNKGNTQKSQSTSSTSVTTVTDHVHEGPRHPLQIQQDLTKRLLAVTGASADNTMNELRLQQGIRQLQRYRLRQQQLRKIQMREREQQHQQHFLPGGADGQHWSPNINSESAGTGNYLSPGVPSDYATYEAHLKRAVRAGHPLSQHERDTYLALLEWFLKRDLQEVEELEKKNVGRSSRERSEEDEGPRRARQVLQRKRLLAEAAAQKKLQQEQREKEILQRAKKLLDEQNKKLAQEERDRLVAKQQLLEIERMCLQQQREEEAAAEAKRKEIERLLDLSMMSDASSLSSLPLPGNSLEDSFAADFISPRTSAMRSVRGPFSNINSASRDFLRQSLYEMLESDDDNAGSASRESPQNERGRPVTTSIAIQVTETLSAGSQTDDFCSAEAGADNRDREHPNYDASNAPTISASSPLSSFPQHPTASHKPFDDASSPPHGSWNGYKDSYGGHSPLSYSEPRSVSYNNHLYYQDVDRMPRDWYPLVPSSPTLRSRSSASPAGWR